MNFTVDFTKEVGKIKPMHGVGQPPMLGVGTGYFHYLTEAKIPYSRLHDVGGAYGGNMYVDIPNVFRDFDADENDPANYDFAFTDILMQGLVKAGCEPIYRLGVTIENYHKIKSYRIYPPKDFAKWARICEHIIRHYNEGWANGYKLNVQYWEIWNEADCRENPAENSMWKGTFEEYIDLYRVSATYLKEKFPHLKFGGYAGCGFYHFGYGELTWEADIFKKHFYMFMDAVKKDNLPLDFFSWHHYTKEGSPVLEAGAASAKFVRESLDEYGYTHTISMCNEWNVSFEKQTRGKSKQCADTAGFMCLMQDTPVDIMCYYDARIGASYYGGMFSPITYEPFCLYYGFVAFGKLYEMGTQVKTSNNCDGLYSVAATNGRKKGVLIANINEDINLDTNLSPDMTLYIIDEDNMLVPTKINPVHFTLKKNQVVYIEG